MGVLSLLLKVVVAAGLLAGVVLFGIPDIPAIPLGNLDPDNVDTGGPSAAVVEDRVAALANAERRARGHDPLQNSSEIAAVAAGHSRDMAANRYFAHESPDGETLEDRYAADGIQCDAGAENIYRMTWEDQSFTSDELARRTVDSWLDSQEHRENLLSSEFAEQGIGVEIDQRGEETVLYVTQNFCG